MTYVRYDPAGSNAIEVIGLPGGTQRLDPQFKDELVGRLGQGQSDATIKAWLDGLPTDYQDGKQGSRSSGRVHGKRVLT